MSIPDEPPTLVNFIVYKQNKSSNHINQHKTDKLFTINYPFSLFYIYKSIMKSPNYEA